MGYNWQKQKMKKLIVLIATMVCLGLYANAQTSSGSCKLPGSYDYVNVDYYESDGHIAVSNQSGMKITQLHITITCTITYNRPAKPGDFGGRTTTTVTVCDKNFYDIPANQTTTLSDGVKSKNDIKRDDAVSYEYTVTVGNPICK